MPGSEVGKGWDGDDGAEGEALGSTPDSRRT